MTRALAAAAIDRLDPTPGERVIDIGAGTGGAALMLAARGANVLAVDASPRMVERIRARLAERPDTAPRVRAEIMDGTALAVADATMDAALSVFGVVLFPDAAAGVAEMTRVLKPHGRAALVTWTEPENYRLMAELLAAIRAAIPDFPPPPRPPPQLRFKDEAEFRTLLEGGGLRDVTIERVTGRLEAPGARWLAQRLAFAPGMAALLGMLGERREDVTAAFVERIEAAQGRGPIALAAVAFVGSGRAPGKS
ncbi:MAG TPA: class I SAM-dependent methyltransferase [Xanthobacteraceae bacterium]|nr:class I SAM-dependent methyltransferase [Xanthobacteraceae bacterium]